MTEGNVSTRAYVLGLSALLAQTAVGAWVASKLRLPRTIGALGALGAAHWANGKVSPNVTREQALSGAPQYAEFAPVADQLPSESDQFIADLVTAPGRAGEWLGSTVYGYVEGQGLLESGADGADGAGVAGPRPAPGAPRPGPTTPPWAGS